MTERRRFSRREKNIFYRSANGRCADCDTPLNEGWHGDHIIPVVAHGETRISNGQALCPPCNLKKGSSMVWNDRIRLRQFQKELIKTVVARTVAGESVTIALVSPGSGKTLGYQAVATELIRRQTGIDLIAVYAPRLVLAKQAEIDWRHEVADPHSSGGRTEEGDFENFDARCRLEWLRHRANVEPLLPAVARREGFVTTYQSLVTEPDLHIDWAKRNAGRFLLVGDEAQFLGAPMDDEDDKSPKAGQYFEQMAQYAGHTLLLTGTEERADGRKLVLCGESYRQNDKGRWHLTSHVSARYRDGIALRYLRQFDAAISDAKVTYWPTESESVEYDLSKSGELPDSKRAALARVLRQDQVWQPLCDLTVKRLRHVQQVNKSYRALIACMEQGDAKRVVKYLTETYPTLKVGKATTEDGPKAEAVLRDFKTQPYDVLVTVRKAFIGYDCPQITVVCPLTNYRNIGHLTQLAFRGGRVWKPEESGQDAAHQRMHLIVPDDPAMNKFIEFLRREESEGLRDRERREGPGDGPWPGQDGRMEGAEVTTTRGANYERDLTEEEYESNQAILDELGAITTPEGIQQLLLRVGAESSKKAQAPRAKPTPKTESEIVKELRSEAARCIGQYLRERQHDPSDPDYGQVRARLTRQINKRFTISSTDEITTAGKARDYVTHVRTFLRLDEQSA